MNTLWQIPVVVASLVAWLSQSPLNLSDAAGHELLRRTFAGRSVATFTNQDLRQFVVTVVAEEPHVPAAGEDADGLNRGESYWRDRLAAARAQVERDDTRLTMLQAQIDALTADLVSRNEPDRQARLKEELLRSAREFDRLQNAVVAGRQAVDEIRSEAQKAGVPAAWLR